MSEHIEETGKVGAAGPTGVVLDGGRRNVAPRLGEYDATVLVGLRTLVRDAAIEYVDDEGEMTVELPKLPQLMAAAAVSRCLAPDRLRGPEIKAIRHIMKLTLGELAKRMDERTAAETVSRWESEAQPMGSYAERVLRLLVCETLAEQAPGIDYRALRIVNLTLADPWKADPAYETPYVELVYGRVKEQAGPIIEAWNAAA